MSKANFSRSYSPGLKVPVLTKCWRSWCWTWGGWSLWPPGLGTTAGTDGSLESGDQRCSESRWSCRQLDPCPEGENGKRMRAQIRKNDLGVNPQVTIYKLQGAGAHIVRASHPAAAGSNPRSTRTHLVLIQWILRLQLTAKDWNKCYKKYIN